MFRNIVVLSLGLILCGTTTFAAEKTDEQPALWIGTGAISITPDRPACLDGQFHTRIARTADSPCTANVLALESRRGDKVQDTAIAISCDLLCVTDEVRMRFRRKIAMRLPGLDVKKTVINATHAHTAPTTIDRYVISEGVIKPDEYIDFLTDRLCDAAVKAWESRRPGGVSWGLGHAVVAQNRRMVYADGSARMYGPTNVDNFRRIEGREDHGVQVFFFWDENKKLIAAAVNVACPSQGVEGGSAVNSDYWHEVREGLKKKYGENLCVLGWCGAAGDQSPHIMWRNAAEDRMCKKRGLTRLQEIARRIVCAVDDTYEVAKKDVVYDVPLVHVVADIKLPLRLVNDEEYAQSKAVCGDLTKKKQLDPNGDAFVLWWHKGVVDRYESQKTNPFYDMELHVIRLGESAIATNDFELYTDYGIQIQARSKALQTFVIQLAGPGTYLPTAEAVKGGSYSTEVMSNIVGPEGGQVLVDRTVEKINKLWDEKKNDNN